MNPAWRGIVVAYDAYIHGPRGDNATASRAMAPEGFVSIVDERVDDEG